MPRLSTNVVHMGLYECRSHNLNSRERHCAYVAVIRRSKHMSLSSRHRRNTWALFALSKKSKTLLEIYFIFLDSWHNYVSFGIWKTFLAQLPGWATMVCMNVPMSDHPTLTPGKWFRTHGRCWLLAKKVRPFWKFSLYFWIPGTIILHLTYDTGPWHNYRLSSSSRHRRNTWALDP